MTTRANCKTVLKRKAAVAVAADSASTTGRPSKQRRTASRQPRYKEDSDDEWILDDEEPQLTEQEHEAKRKTPNASGPAAVAPSTPRSSLMGPTRALPPSLMRPKTASTGDAAKAPLSAPAVDLKLPAVKPGLLQGPSVQQQHKAPLAVAQALPPATAASVEVRVVSTGQSMGGDLVVLAGTRQGTPTYIRLPARLADSPAAQQLRGLRCGQCALVKQVVPEPDVRLHAFMNSAPHIWTETSTVEVLPEPQDWPPVQLEGHFSQVSQLGNVASGNRVCIRGYTGTAYGMELEHNEDTFELWKLPVCTADGIVAASARAMLSIPAEQPICLFGAVVKHYQSKQGPATVLNLNRGSFWVVGDSALVGPGLLTWWSQRPTITDLADVSITSLGVPWDQAVPFADCSLAELPAYIMDGQPRVRLQQPVPLELVSLVATNKFCYAGCAVPFCRAKVEEAHVTERDGFTLYRCNAQRPHLCLTYSWRYMCQGLFKPVGQSDAVLTVWLRDPAVAAILGISADAFSLLTPQQKLETTAARRSGGTYQATITCERPSGTFNRGNPVLYCGKLVPVAGPSAPAPGGASS